MIDINEPYLFSKIEKFVDLRGEFYKFFDIDEKNPITCQNFIQENISISKLNVVRGLHYQFNSPMGKLIRVSYGKILDVIVDIRKNSKNFGKIYYYELSDQNLNQIWIPPHFAHGFITLSDISHVNYKCTSKYNKDGESGIYAYDDFLNIEWGISREKAIMSDRDKNLQSFKNYINNSIY